MTSVDGGLEWSANIKPHFGKVSYIKSSLLTYQFFRKSVDIILDFEVLNYLPYFCDHAFVGILLHLLHLVESLVYFNQVLETAFSIIAHLHINLK